MSVAEALPAEQDFPLQTQIQEGAYDSILLHGVAEDGNTIITVCRRPVWKDGAVHDEVCIIALDEDELTTNDFDVKYARDILHGVMYASHDRRVLILERQGEEYTELGKLTINHEWWRVETQEITATCRQPVGSDWPDPLDHNIVRLYAATI